ncbi:MAG: FHA domain-containing protein [Myxococcota bacterium]
MSSTEAPDLHPSDRAAVGLAWVPWRLRALSGPQAGAVYPLRDVTWIGRALQAEIQLHGLGVSRFHAQIRALASGAIEICDMGSTYGVRVDGARIEDACVLEEGARVVIGGTELVFESEDDPIAAQPSAASASVVGVDDGYPASTRESESHMGMRLPGDVDGIGESKASMSGRFAMYDDPGRPVVPRLVGAAPIVAGADVVATANVSGYARALAERQGQEYVELGIPRRLEAVSLQAQSCAVMQRVLEYRDLRLRMLEGEVLQPPTQARLSALQQDLLLTHAHSETLAGRGYARFACALPATLTQADDVHVRELDVAIEDLSAGGARVQLLDAGVAVGQTLWMSFARAPELPVNPVMGLRCRVVRVCRARGTVAVMFIGNLALRP